MTVITEPGGVQVHSVIQVWRIEVYIDEVNPKQSSLKAVALLASLDEDPHYTISSCSLFGGSIAYTMRGIEKDCTVVVNWGSVKAGGAGNASAHDQPQVYPRWYVVGQRASVSVFSRLVWKSLLKFIQGHVPPPQ